MIKPFLFFFIWVHNLSYRAISILAVYTHNGLHPKHDILKYHTFFTNNISATDVVLDIGCGNGAVAYDISKKASSVIGIDILRTNISTAKKKYAHDNLHYILGDATTFEFEEKINIIVLSNVLEHIKNRVKFLNKIKLLAPVILIRVPLITRDWLSVYKKEMGLNYKLDNTHFIEYTEETFRKEIQNSGLAIENYYTKFGELYAIVK